MQCSFEKLIQYLDEKMDLDQQIELLDHLDYCETCREAICQIARDRKALTSSQTLSLPFHLQI
jgi:hypothetical protein